MFKKSGLILVTILIFMILFYSATSIHIGKFITVTEISTLIKAIVIPESEGTLVLDNQVYKFVLPKHTALLEENTKYKTYFTLTTYPGLHDYYNKELPKTGWKFADQLGSVCIFQRDGMTLISSRRTFLMGIEIVTFSIRHKSS